MNKKALEAVALSIRSLAMDGVQKANSGHPGLPMGVAEFGALLYGEVMKHHPGDSKWIDRDRFVLSAGHGSMFLYSLLHLAGYKVSLEDLKNFRQLGSRTPGHPEYGWTDGVETTTGPLGAGFSNAVGMAIAESMLAAKFNTPARKIIDHFTYVLSSDGCMMEGISSEAASLAGHLALGKLIVFYDSNKITIEGSTELAFTEDTGARFAAYGWQVLNGDAYNLVQMADLVNQAKAETGRPSIIILTSVIGKGSPNKAGSHDVHGAPLGAEEIAATRKNLGIPDGAEFFIHPEAKSYFADKKAQWEKAYKSWKETFSAWAKENPDLKKEFDIFTAETPDFSGLVMPDFKIGDKMATRSASGKSLQAAAKAVPNLVGGSADLAPSNNTALPDYGDYNAQNRSGRTLHFGVREHAMGGVVNGICLHGGLRPFCATFLVFADYMRPAIRLAAIMKLPIIYVFTHDSIFVGEDGPTHQPVEHIASLRVIPNVVVLRPGDAQETAAAWKMALSRTDGPTVLALTRQNLEVYAKTDKDWMNTITKGAYVVQDGGDPDVVVVASGSEVELAIKAAAKVKDRKIRIVSMLSMELFLKQDKSFWGEIIPPGVRTITAEAGVTFGWTRIASSSRDILGLDRFGESGPAAKVAEHLGITVEALASLIQAQ
ncbi:MAG: transketolase [Spirochaetales bacterium]|nr:MAG: transketolase [Spirochaetales bacterium]